jgi:hypothetical protein
MDFSSFKTLKLKISWVKKGKESFKKLYFTAVIICMFCIESEKREEGRNLVPPKM